MSEQVSAPRKLQWNNTRAQQKRLLFTFATKCVRFLFYFAREGKPTERWSPPTTRRRSTPFERERASTMSHEHQSEEDTATIQRLVRTRARAPHVPHPSDDLTSVPRPSQLAMPDGLGKLGLGPDTKLVAAFIAELFAANNPGCIPSLSEPRPLRTPAICSVCARPRSVSWSDDAIRSCALQLPSTM